MHQRRALSVNAAEAMWAEWRDGASPGESGRDWADRGALGGIGVHGRVPARRDCSGRTSARVVGVERRGPRRDLTRRGCGRVGARDRARPRACTLDDQSRD